MANEPINPDFLAPCGLYCGVCAIHIADRDDNLKFKQRTGQPLSGPDAG